MTDTPTPPTEAEALNSLFDQMDQLIHLMANPLTTKPRRAALAQQLQGHLHFVRRSVVEVTAVDLPAVSASPSEPDHG